VLKEVLGFLWVSEVDLNSFPRFTRECSSLRSSLSSICCIDSIMAMVLGFLRTYELTLIIP